MKKSIIVLALALLMIVPVFAATAKVVTPTSGTIGKTGETESTNVKINLALNPKYVFGITDKDNKFNDQKTLVTKTTVGDKEIKYSEAPVVETINMEADYDNLYLKSTASATYYVSYWFYECGESVTLTAGVDGALKYQGTNSDSNKKDYIDFRATITASSDADKATETAVTLDSNGKDTGETKTIVTCSKVDTLGKVYCGNMEIVLGPKGGTATVNDLATNVVGDYLAHIVLTLKAGA